MINIAADRYKDYIYKSYFYLVSLLALSLPYLGLLSVWDKSNFLAVFLKEIIVVILLLSFIYVKRIPKVLILLLVLMAGAIALSLFLGQGIKGILLGIKYDFMPLLLLISIVATGIISWQKSRLLIRFLTLNALFLSALSVLQQIFPIWWEYIGFNSNNINPYQLVDPALGLVRSFVFSAGPNQFGLYLTMILGINLYYDDLYKKNALYYRFTIIMLVIGIIMTFSRSAFLAMTIILFYRLYILIKPNIRLYLRSYKLAIFIMVMILVGAFIYKNTTEEGSKIGYLIHHGRILNKQVQGSDSLRLEALSGAMNSIKKAPLTGYGLGSSGPATLHNNSNQISENWFLQIFYELGIPLAIFYFITLYYIWRYIGLGLKSMVAIIVPIAVSGLFLHSFADSMVGYSSVIFLALLSLIKNKSLHNYE